MNKISVFAALVGLLMSFNTTAQKVSLVDGNVAPLKGEKKVNIQFVYDGMGVGSFADEKDYVAKKKKEYNEKEPGRGDNWEKSWIGDRKNRFEPQFIELFSKHSGIIVGNYPDAKYTLVFKTTFTEPGFNIYIARKNASVNGIATVVETSSKKQLAEYRVNKAPGRTFGGYDYDSGTRVQEAYATAGKGLGKTIGGSLKKLK